MRIHVWLGLWVATSLCTALVQAQPASQEQIQKALELLRKTSSTPVPATNSPAVPPPAPLATTNNAAFPAKPTTPVPSPTPVQAETKAPVTPAPVAPKDPGIPATKPVQPIPTVQPVQNATPAGLTAAEEQKARDLLRSTAVTETPTVTGNAPSDQERDQAIRSALDEAHRLDAERKQTRKQNPQAANEAAMQAEILRIESELLKAKQDHPPSVDLVRPAGSQSVTSLPSTAPPPAAPRNIPPPAPIVQSPTLPAATIPATPRSIPPPAPVALPPTQPAAVAPATPPSIPTRTPRVQPPAQPAAAVAPTVPASPPKSAPPATASPNSKEKRLADLLEAYRNDQITAAEYHRQRAKVLAEP